MKLGPLFIVVVAGGAVTCGIYFMKNGKILDRRYGADPDMEIEEFFRAWFAKYFSTSLSERGDL